MPQSSYPLSLHRDAGPIATEILLPIPWSFWLAARPSVQALASACQVTLQSPPTHASRYPGPTSRNLNPLHCLPIRCAWAPVASCMSMSTLVRSTFMRSRRARLRMPQARNGRSQGRLRQDTNFALGLRACVYSYVGPTWQGLFVVDRTAQRLRDLLVGSTAGRIED